MTVNAYWCHIFHRLRFALRGYAGSDKRYWWNERMSLYLHTCLLLAEIFKGLLQYAVTHLWHTVIFQNNADHPTTHTFHSWHCVTSMLQKWVCCVESTESVSLPFVLKRQHHFTLSWSQPWHRSVWQSTPLIQRNMQPQAGSKFCRTLPPGKVLQPTAPQHEFTLLWKDAYIHTYTYIHAYILHTHIHTCVHTTYTYIHTHTYTQYIHTHMHTHTHNTYIHTCIHTTYTHMHTYYIHTYITYIHTHTHAYITYIHTYSFQWNGNNKKQCTISVTRLFRNVEILLQDYTASHPVDGNNHWALHTETRDRPRLTRIIYKYPARTAQ